MDKKPSFLERLTGALDDDSAEDQSSNEIQDLNHSDNYSPDSEAIANRGGKKAAPERLRPQYEVDRRPKKISLPAEEKAESDDWLPEAEGQLTIDVYQTPTDIVIKSTIAGVDPANLDITVTNDMVTIKGKREKDETISSGDYYYQECYWGAFSRSVILPVDVESDKAEASMKNGILTIRLPKIEKVRTKKIKVLSS